MPLYPFLCQCGIEIVVNKKEPPKRIKCKECGKAMKRVWSPIGISFKGSGFHCNDYKHTSSEVVKEDI